jgi:hypothetical protein
LADFGGGEWGEGDGRVMSKISSLKVDFEIGA